jgi:nitrogen regulatory protein PII
MTLVTATLVTAVIKPFKLDGVRAALLALGVPGMTVSMSSGDGPVFVEEIHGESDVE